MFHLNISVLLLLILTGATRLWYSSRICIVFLLRFTRTSSSGVAVSERCSNLLLSIPPRIRRQDRDRAGRVAYSASQGRWCQYLTIMSSALSCSREGSVLANGKQGLRQVSTGRPIRRPDRSCHTLTESQPSHVYDFGISFHGFTN